MKKILIAVLVAFLFSSCQSVVRDAPSWILVNPGDEETHYEYGIDESSVEEAYSDAVKRMENWISIKVGDISFRRGEKPMSIDFSSLRTEVYGIYTSRKDSFSSVLIALDRSSFSSFLEGQGYRLSEDEISACFFIGH